ncbi:ribonuclease H-like protein [Xylaria cf. heliscus]|nr:ribonuclease H-like protein [Xylaria cf. heliscus]
MTATPPRINNQLWHPARGISFSPGPAPRASLAQSPHTILEIPAGVSQYHVTTSNTISALSEDALAAAVARPPSLDIGSLAKHVDKRVLAQATAETDAVVNEGEGKAAHTLPPPVLEYKMVDDLFYAAKRSPPGSPESFWSYSQYRCTAEDGSQEKVKVHYCRSRSTMERVCKQYFMGEEVLGFDLEWMAEATRNDSLKRNISLIQLASPSRIGLFHVALFPDGKDMVGPSFRDIMGDPNITKVGVAIKGDTTRLRNFLDIQSRGLMELSNLYKLVKYSRNRQYDKIDRKLVPLATQVQEHLHLPLFKGQDVRASNWTKPLDMKQVLYSASDAYAGVHLYATLDHHRKQLDPCPPLPHFAELNLAIPFVEQSLSASLDPLGVEDEETISISSVTVSKRKSVSTTVKPKTPERSKDSKDSKDSRIEVTEDRVASYRASHPETSLKPAQLRSYFLWHHYDLPPSAVAQLVREPPLKTLTVAQYILDALQAEKMPVDRDRLYEVAGFIPPITLWAKWPKVANMIADMET